MNTAILTRPDDMDRSALAFSLPMQLALAGLAGLLLAMGYLLHPFWWAPWLAPVPLILAGAGSGRGARLAGGIAGVTATVGILGYYVGMMGWGGTLAIVLLRAASWNSASRLTQVAARRLPLGAAMLVLPVAMAAFETLTLAVSPHGAAGSLAYAQMNMPGLIQTAALGGAPAIVFCVLLPGSLVGLFLIRRWPSRQLRAGSIAFGGIVAAVALFSFVRLIAPADGPAIPATLIATDKYDGIPKDWENVWATYRPAVERSAKADGLVVLPEKIALVDKATADRAGAAIADAARLTGSTIVAGIEVKDGAVYRNRALVAAPDGTVVVWYDKQRLVPGFEARDTPGKTPLFAAAAGTRFGVAICKDMHIPGIGREYAGQAAIMTVPAWDFGQDGWMGARMTALRAVENGYAIARSARDGFVGAYDRTGRVLIERPTGDGMTVAEATLPAQGHETLYAKVGNLFGWICVSLILVLIGWNRATVRKL